MNRPPRHRKPPLTRGSPLWSRSGAYLVQILRMTPGAALSDAQTAEIRPGQRLRHHRAISDRAAEYRASHRSPPMTQTKANYCVALLRSRPAHRCAATVQGRLQGHRRAAIGARGGRVYPKRTAPDPRIEALLNVVSIKRYRVRVELSRRKRSGRSLEPDRGP